MLISVTLADTIDISGKTIIAGDLPNAMSTMRKTKLWTLGVKESFRNGLLTLLLNPITLKSQFICRSSAIPDCLVEIEIRGFLCNYYKGFLRQQLNITLMLNWSPLQEL